MFSIVLAAFYFAIYPWLPKEDITADIILGFIVSLVSICSIGLAFFRMIKMKNLLYGTLAIIIEFITEFFDKYNLSRFTNLLVVFLIFVAIFGVKKFILFIKNQKFEKEYSGLSISDKNIINNIKIKLKDINNDVFKTLPKKYCLYNFLYKISLNLSKDEEIIFFSKSFFTEKYYIIVTNNKILIMSDTIQTFYYEKIISCELVKNKIYINNSNNMICFKIHNKIDSQKIFKLINKEIENRKNFNVKITQVQEKDVLDKISKLQVLYDEGILTEYEFNIKKLELLEKIK